MRKRQSRLPATLIAIGILATVSGCRNGQSPGEAASHHDDEPAGHVIPAHKPKDFPSAVRRLREWNGQIASNLLEGKARSLVEDKTLSMTLDIANWLPEIAADSDMPEAPWNQVNDLAATLVGAYQNLLDGATTGNPSADGALTTKATDSAITSLETILKKADPRWFATDGLHPGAKS